MRRKRALGVQVGAGRRGGSAQTGRRPWAHCSRDPAGCGQELVRSLQGVVAEAPGGLLGLAPGCCHGWEEVWGEMAVGLGRFHDRKNFDESRGPEMPVPRPFPCLWGRAMTFHPPLSPAFAER